MADRREFIGTYECMGGNTYAADFRWAILGEAEEVVRCRDCRHRYDFGDRHWCDFLTEGSGFQVDLDCFCCWGARKS